MIWCLLWLTWPCPRWLRPSPNSTLALIKGPLLPHHYLVSHSPPPPHLPRCLIPLFCLFSLSPSHLPPSPCPLSPSFHLIQTPRALRSPQSYLLCSSCLSLSLFFLSLYFISCTCFFLSLLLDFFLSCFLSSFLSVPRVLCLAGFESLNTGQSSEGQLCGWRDVGREGEGDMRLRQAACSHTADMTGPVHL